MAIVPFDWETAGWGPPLADLASIDLDAYGEEACGLWGGHRTELERLSCIGQLFRLLTSVSWDSTWLTKEWVSRPPQTPRPI